MGKEDMNNTPEPKSLTRKRKKRRMATQTGGGAENTHTGWRAYFEYHKRSLGEKNSTRNLPNV